MGESSAQKIFKGNRTVKCPHHIKPPASVAMLPKDERGFPIPFFAPTHDGKPLFSVSDERKRMRCAKEQLCWICGQPLFELMAFIGGEQSCKNRAFTDAGMHVECAVYAVQVCPFMASPDYKRRAFEHLGMAPPGFIPEKPRRQGVFITRGFKIARFPNGEWIFRPDQALEIQWWKNGERIEA